MTIAEQVNNDIREHYSSGHINHADLIDHLQQNRIDNFDDAAAPHHGCNIAYDGSMGVFYYPDDSALMVTACSIEPVKIL